MSTPANPFALAGWRRTVAAHYAAVREATSDPAVAAGRFRHDREVLFRRHSESPIAPQYRAEWAGLDWFPYDLAWRVTGTIDRDVTRETLESSLGSDGALRCTRIGRVHFSVGAHKASLAVYWLEGYGGGLWLPFTDLTSGVETYGGGRYLYDTIKGADLGVTDREVVLDFNYAYNPSCAFDPRWSCPLSPPENRLPFRVVAGERVGRDAIKP
jgi:uncharacterized protein (DUF1684 family)